MAVFLIVINTKGKNHFRRVNYSTKIFNYFGEKF